MLYIVHEMYKIKLEYVIYQKSGILSETTGVTLKRLRNQLAEALTGQR